MENLTVNDYTGLIGNVTNPYLQMYKDTCAIKSQQLIMNDFGLYLSEDQLVQYSIDKGWYSGNGTMMQDVGKLLVEAGIPCSQSYAANVYDLVNELAQGHKVIVAVDSGELWDNGILDWLKDLFVDTPDHALIVAGIDISNPDNPMVVLTDPGTGQPAQPYPLEQFMDAWKDSQNFMVSTQVPTPQSFELFKQYGMNEMHLPSVSGVDYDTFQNFRNYSHLVDQTSLPDLYSAFQEYPTIPDYNFNSVMHSCGLPYFDMNMMPFDSMAYNPYEFDYQALNVDNWMDFPSVSELETKIHSFETLTNLHQEAVDYAKQCMDDGMYISAQMWQQQANDIQNQIDEL